MNNYILWGLFGPATWLFWAILLYWGLRAGGRTGAARWVLIVAWVDCLLLASPWFAQMLIAPLEARHPAPDPWPRRIDGIVLLSGSESWSPWTPARGLQTTAAGDRYLTTATLAARYPRAKVVFVGAQPKEGKSNSDMALSFLRPLMGSRVRVIPDTANTCHNAQAVADSKLVRRPDRWLLVTSAAHMPRAMACFAHYGLSLVPAPADYRAPETIPFPPRSIAAYLPTGAMLDTSSIALHEWLGMAWYRWTGRLDRKAASG